MPPVKRCISLDSEVDADLDTYLAVNPLLGPGSRSKVVSVAVAEYLERHGKEG